MMARATMTVEFTHFCDHEGCEVFQRSAEPPPYLPAGWVTAIEHLPVGEKTLAFCSWDHCMLFAASVPPSEEVGVGFGDGE